MDQKILFIAYHYPPRGGVAVIRTVKFLKYLPKFGWQPTVLTLRTGRYMVKDLTLIKEVPHTIKVHRATDFGESLFGLIRKAGFKKWNGLPDKESGWVPAAALKAAIIVMKERIPVVYTTSPPHSTHLVGYLCKRATAVRWVADFRDLWCGNRFFVSETGSVRRLHEKLEKLVITNADFVIANTHHAVSYFHSKYPSLKEKFIWIPNGFDPEDFEHPPPPPAKRSGKLTLTYVGSYGGTRPMDFFFQALRELADQFPEVIKTIQVVFIGLTSLQTQRLAEKFGLSSIIIFRGHLPHKEAITCMLESDVLLLFQFEEHGGSSALPSKVFEYMKAKKIIFAQVCKGPAIGIVRNYKGGYVADPKDTNQIKDILHILYTKFRSGLLTDIQDPAVENFSRIRQTEQLDTILRAQKLR